MSGQVTRLSRRSVLKWAGVGGAAALLAGCGGTAAPTSAPAPAAPTTAPGAAPTTAAAAPTAAAKVTPVAKVVTVSFSSHGTVDILQMFDDVLTAFEKKYPNIKVNRMLDPALTWEKIATMVVGDTAASVQRMNNDDLFKFISTGKVHVLDELVKRDIKKDDYYPIAFTSLLGPKGEMGALITGAATRTIQYNVDHFKEAGLEAPTDWAKPWDFKTFDAALDKLVKKDASGKTTRYAFNLDDTWCASMPENWGAVKYNECETEFLWGKQGENDPAMRAYQWMSDIYCKRKVAPPPGENPYALFNSGVLSMITESMRQVTQIKAGVNWDIMPMFLGDARPPDTAHNYNEAPEILFSIPSSEKEKDAAWELLKFLFTETGQEGLAKTDYAVPCMKKVAEGPVFMDPKRAPKNRILFAKGLAYDVDMKMSNPMAVDFINNYARTVNELKSCVKTAPQFMTERAVRMKNSIADNKWDKCKK